VVLASGCATFSPVQTDENYLPADGVQLTVPGLDLRDVAILAAAEGGPGVIIGQAINDGPSAIDVTFGVEGAKAPVTAVVPANSAANLSTPSTRVELESVPAAPGAVVELTVVTKQAGTNVVRVPVLAPEGPYADLRP
jgi:hypothetical protein